MLLYIIRHGDPCYETDSLTPRGVRQAEALSRRLAVSRIDEIYSSPLGRAVQTARPTAEVLKKDIRIENWMSEDLAWNDFSVPDEDGVKNWFFACRNAEFLKDGVPLDSQWYNHAILKNCPSAQRGYERIREASDDFLARLGYKREGAVYRKTNPERANKNRVAAFCHHGLGTAWMSHLLSIPPLLFWAGFNITHSGVTVLEFADHEDGITAPQCLIHSDMSHIYQDRLPAEYNNHIII